jgi:hypothetical protein
VNGSAGNWTAGIVVVAGAVVAGAVVGASVVTASVVAGSVAAGALVPVPAVESSLHAAIATAAAPAKNIRREIIGVSRAGLGWLGGDVGSRIGEVCTIRPARQGTCAKTALR